MSSTDERIVKMKFDNAEFKKGAVETKKSLDDVNKAVDSAGKGKGLMNLDGHMQRVAVSASKMSIVATTALATITNKAVNAGLSLAKSLTFDPIKQGFQEYESLLTKQNVIQNATGKSAKVVKGVLNELNRYSDKTIYSFGNMTDAVQKFVNAGVPLKQSVTSIKGIANAAAFAGASSEEANRAMYAFAQSMSLGFIQLQDWNQIENANMGTVKFKNQLLEAGVAVGTLTKKGGEYVTKSGKVVSATKGWRDGLQEQWATTKVLNKALGQYADTSTTLGRKAFKAAQDVRTFSAFMDTLKESLGSGWAQIFTALFGNLQQSTKMWTSLSNTVGSSVQNFFNFATAALTVWRNMGGAQKVFQGFKNLLSPIAAILDVVGTAWRKAFPDSGKGAGKGLYAISAGFAAITSPLQLVAKLIHGLTTPMTIFFQLVKIGAQVLGSIGGKIGDFIGNVGDMVNLKAPSSGGFLGWLKMVGDAIKVTLDRISKLLAQGKSVKDAFSGAFSSIKMPKMPNMPSMPKMPDIGASFGGGKSAAAGMAGPLASMTGGMDKAKAQFKSLGDAAKTTGGEVKSAGSMMADGVKVAWEWFQKFLDSISAEDVIAAFNSAILATFMFQIIRFVNSLTNAFKAFSNVGGGFASALEGVGAGLKSFQTQAKAKLILNIGLALLALAAALWIISKIPMKNLGTSLVAVGVTLHFVGKTMEAVGDMAKKLDGVKMALNLFALSAALVALGFAMILLATAMLIMNKVKWESVAKGLGTMYVTMKLMESLGSQSKEAAKNMVSGAAAIALVAGAMILLATALLMFKLVDWGSMGKAGVALLGVSLAVGALALIPYEGIAKVGLALALASVGMVAMATALIMFSVVKWESIGKAAVVLVALGVAMAIMMAVGGPGAAGTLLALGVAMVALAMACMIFNNVEWASIGKAAVVLTALLVAVALGAVILTAFLYAIAPVSPVLIILAAGFFLLGLGLLAFAGAMAIAITLGAAGVAAFAAFATGAAVAVAVFLQTLATEAPLMKKSFLTILQTLIDTIVQAVPMVIDGIKRLWAAVKKELSGDDKKKGAGDAGKGWMDSLYAKINQQLPKIVAKAGDLAIRFIKALASRGAEMGAAATGLIARFIGGVASRIGAVAQQGANLIIRFIQAITTQYARIANAAANAVITFINRMADSIRSKGPQLGAAMGNLGVAMIQGLIGGIGSMFGAALSSIGNVVSGMIKHAKSLAKVFSPSRVFNDIGYFMVKGLTNGITNNAAAAITAVGSMVSGQIAVANDYISRYIQNLDQSALKARGKAQGLAAAAAQAAKAAKLTKGKTDDVYAKRMKAQATAADKAADKKEAAAAASKRAQDNAEKWAAMSNIEKAKSRSESAQSQLAAAKASERAAEADRVQAAALLAQSRRAGLSVAERVRLRAQAAAARKAAIQEAKNANTHLASAKANAASALEYQKKAGAEAAAAYQASFDADAKAAADAAAFAALSNTDKAAARRKEAADLQAKSVADLDKAKKLAYTDLAGANTLAQQANDEANKAREILEDAKQYDTPDAATPGITGGDVNGTVVNLAPTDAAAIAMNDYADLYSSAAAAAAAGKTVEFNQYNTSPEALSPIDIYRQTNNLFTYAVDKIDSAA